MEGTGNTPSTTNGISQYVGEQAYSNLQKIESQDAASASTPEAKQASSFEAFAEEMRGFMEETRGRIKLLGQDLGKVREKTKSETTKSQPGNSENWMESQRAEISAAVKVTDLMNRFPPAVKEKIEAKIADRPYTETLEIVSLISEALSLADSATGSQRPRGVPSGVPANAPSNNSQRWPTSVRELMELRRTDPKYFAEIMAGNHPFNPEGLPLR